ncbi:type I-F CRISPR-associated endoribonuclease Cas6/Csy4 [Pseudobacteriovorax antillogorgiicola]|uniref:CRISPR-associated protein, Csy4 family n=1 Tax=Pseudobacteriovorax antillogorgiicola TaxID=1513793 RepID=A0A1Y6C6B3_9BACT|nr:type I-F CRISPR-associated endoribonuclease Cas6/Csy4 [Pseudobacteriovorax antillogorgiicola]TCS49874.1 CRISPR-associated Csy4 family protein [Pseudobacteriovorax antillogorgiicola]SMF44202.1 CRISPR-associated protein, Csy4 family [Pseudobacteriovorax antillogorgiicola]
MKYYMELTLLPSMEVDLTFLWKKVFKQIHLCLVENNSGSIGLAWPEYDAESLTVGSKLRLFAKDESELHSLDLKKWLIRLRDYVHIRRARIVPSNIEHVCFVRKNNKKSIEKLARRASKRHGIDFDTAIKEIRQGEQMGQPRLPRIEYESLTNHHVFPIFIEKNKRDGPQEGVFSAYGLSSQSTVPDFP